MPSQTQRWQVNATGTGIFTAQSPQPVRGELKTIGVHFGGSAPATTTVQIVTVDGDFSVHQTLLNLAAGNTDAWYYPRPAAQDNTGAQDLYAVGGTPVPMWFFIEGYLNLSMNHGISASFVEVVVLLCDD